MKKVFFAMLMMVSSITWAQEIPSKPAAEGKESKEMTSLRMASNLVRYGYNQQEALPLVNALQILSSVQTQDFTDKKENADEKQPEAKESKLSFDIPKILADAKEMAAGDEHILALISNIEGDLKPHRGAVGGPKCHVDYVRAYSSDSYSCSFIANRVAEILVSGDGDTDLDVYVYDSNGNLIDSDTDWTDDCYLRWVPRWTGRYTIKVVNRGGVYNKYIIVTN